MSLRVHESIQQKLISFYRTKRIPHIIFYGSSGCGKHTIVYDFLKLIYGGLDSHVDSNVLFVNCAHGKGIKFIREELKFFAMTNVDFQKSTKTGVSFKTIVLTSADHLTVDAQSAMRRCIEQYSHNTRFFILVENKHKLLTPILSRFCEIYVPDTINGSTSMNLHEYQLNVTFPIRPKIGNRWFELEAYLSPYFGKEKEWRPVEISELTLRLYDLSFHGGDVLNWVENTNYFTDLQKTNIQMCFAKIKSEFRCEKLLLFYLFDFMFWNSSSDVSTLSFM